MSNTMDPEAVDLAELTAAVRDRCGPRLAGAVVGRTRIRDEVVEQLACSQLEAENLVDTMIGRGFVVRDESGGSVEWVLASE
jgi:hypothetical protein